MLDLLQSTLYTTFDGLDILQDSNADGVVDIDDVVIELYDVKGKRLEDWHVGLELPDDADALQVKALLGGHILGDGIDIPLDFSIPGIALNIDGGFALGVDWSFDFGFGLSVKDGFYLRTNADAFDPEFEFDVALYLDGSPLDPKVITPFTGSGFFLFMQADVVDRDTDASKPGFQPSGIGGGLHIDLSGNAAGRLTVSDLLSNPAEAIDLEFGLSADVRLGVTLSVPDATFMPKMRGDIVFDWDWKLGQAMSAPSFNIEYLRLDLGSFVQDFLKPIADRVSDALGPIKPVVEAFYTRIDGLDLMLDDPTLKGVIDLIIEVNNSAPGAKRISPINWAFLDAARFVLNLPDFVKSLESTGGELVLGHVLGIGSSQVTWKNSAQIDTLVGASGAMSTAPAFLVKKMDDMSRGAQGGGKST
ncbi:MAG: hypothetical protein EBU81_13685, partial [Proteobacteria bacterium]|nr:hypothetical protein [Pseudomonadota bacterium]